MTRDEIYDHLAQVYIGKKSTVEREKKNQLNAWLVMNAVVTLVIFGSAFYGFTAFLSQRSDLFQNKVIYSLSRGPIRITYNLEYPYPPVKSFALTTPQIDAGKYQALRFSIRGMEEGYPDIVRVEVRNNKNETASVFIDSVGLEWQQQEIPFEEFQRISDWTNITEVSFIIESWNTDKKKGIVLIDDICFSS